MKLLYGSCGSTSTCIPQWSVIWSDEERVVDNKTGYVCKNTEDFNSKAIKLLNDDKIWMRMHRNFDK